LRGEQGVTLVELTVAISLLSIVLTIFGGLVVSVQNSLVKETDRSASNDEARLAVEELDREIRSGNVLYDPANGDACQPVNGTPSPSCTSVDVSHGIYPGMSLLVYTQANASSRVGSAGERCVQWRILNGELQRRLWANGSSPPTTWRVVTDHLVNVTGSSPAFSVDPAKRTVTVALLVNQNAKHGNTVRVDTSVEGRNTIYGYPQTVCDPSPPLAY
jgi:prepilin-type N-terminal cleavage/methylation domain-containing protein